MATMIADTACIDPRAEIADGVEIGPYCVIGPDARIGEGTRLIAHVCILGHTTVGDHNVVHPNTVLGGDPQDFTYKGEPTRLEIGDHNTFREGVTIHRGSCKEEGVTRIGSHNYFMANVHVGHDCILGDRILIANNTMLAGHIHMQSHATVSAGCGLHQFVTVGQYSYIGALTRAYHDVPPYMLVEGNPSKVRCINIVGLKRHGISPEAVTALHEAHRLIYRARMIAKQAHEVLEAHGQVCAEVRGLLDFIEAQQQGRHGRGRDRARLSASA
ncbi:acyl-ACP--UDP-N-acetylglucosamine O-acyltransferase [Planctomyces sp. SH-PL62]|uniref:acyl-ACP--UDP-N-acetylglucosamine O-acyltransferase n=1 Tax=Planctomyces sp. SH-PL62 TaxID=1636152 RepID=UPI00078B3563|nr:acyl-ACP--UDP-N-acetylglucosamine O-acyltransferase [Planctomyces sp. SH-PL62]AMV39757.1 Acyl-[acyl-carrier-protein]--UDP-N-acetylglucosamine O-acyltransferase [Planctomyces sp. SH-PL62]